MAENVSGVPKALIEAVEEAAAQLDPSDARILRTALEDYLRVRGPGAASRSNRSDPRLGRSQT